MPTAVVVVTINPSSSQTFGMALTFFFPNDILLDRKNVGVKIENSRVYVMG